MAKSIMQEDYTTCYNCGTPYSLQEHHCIRGNNRQLAEKYGLKVKLCFGCHQGNRDSPHQSEEVNQEYKRLAQEKFVEKYSFEEWLKIFGKNYL